MKKFIIMFFLIHIFSYANYLISNSEIVLFYDKTYNSIQYIRGDVFNNIAISKIEGDIIVDGKDVIHLDDYIQGVELIPQTNILRLHYDMYGKKIILLIIPSMIEKDKLYFIVDTSLLGLDSHNVDFAFRIVPQYDNKYVELLKDDSYKYDKFYFKSENYNGETYICRNSKLDDFTLEDIKDKSKKYEDDNMYYIIKNIKKNINAIFSVKFYNGFNEQDSIKTSDEILSKELGYWNNINQQERFIGKNDTVLGELKNLEIITSRAVIPDQISLNKSKENLDNKMKLFYINSILNKNFNPEKLLEDINIRKKDSEAVLYYTLLFKSLNNTGNYLDKNLFDRKVSLEVLSLLDYVEEIDGEIINVRDNISNYSWYFRMIENIVDRADFKDDRDYIVEKQELLREYVGRYYVLPNGLKTRRDDVKSYYKNIKFMGFMPKEYQLRILNQDYRKYFRKEYGLLIGPDDKEKADLEYNMNFIIKLYENGEYEVADRLFAKIEELIRENNQFLLPQVKLAGYNPVGIYGEMLYLYFTALEYKERYSNGNSK